MATPVIVKGSSFLLTSGSLEMKALVVEDPEPTVGEAEQVSMTASDGTKYATTGETGDNGLNLTLAQTLEDFTAIMTYAYGAPTVVGDVSTWDLTAPSDTASNLTITSPITAGETIAWRLVNAKALSVTPISPLGGFMQLQVNMTGDNWEAELDTSAV